MYAYHALKISEYYIKNVLQESKNVNQFKSSNDQIDLIAKTMSSMGPFFDDDYMQNITQEDKLAKKKHLNDQLGTL